MEKLGKPELREWYASQAITNGWSRAVLEHHLKTVAHQRFGAAPTNFDRLLEPGASELAQQITKDPYVFDFLAVEPGHVERELEVALVERIIDTLGELGSGEASAQATARGDGRAAAVHRQNDRVVRHALATSTHPMAVASYDLLPPAERAALPSEADLGRAFDVG